MKSINMERVFKSRLFDSAWSLYSSSTVVMLCIILLSHSCDGTDPVLSPEVVSGYGNTADNSSTITWASLPAGEAYQTSTEYDDGGLTPLYNFAKHFVNTVQPKDFPYDIVEGLTNDFSGYFSTNRSDVIQYEMGFIVCLAIGILFIILLPVVGILFCCCRMCGNCGGKMEQSREDSQCFIKVLWMVIVSILTLFLSVGMICTYVNNDRITFAMDKIVDNINSNINDVSRFMNNTVDELKHMSTDNFNFTADVIGRDLDNIGVLVGVPVRDELGTTANINNVFDTVLNFSSLIDSTSTSLYAVNDSMTLLKTNGERLASVLASTKSDIDSTLSDPSCTACAGIDTSGLEMDANFTNLPDIASELSKMDGVVSQDLTTTVTNAKTDFENIPQRVTNDTQSTVDSIKTLLSDFSTTINDQVANIEDLPNQVVGDVQSYQDTVNEYYDMVEPYNKYRWAVGIVLAIPVLIITLLQIIGLVLGCIGHKGNALPSERGCLSNCGGIMLMAATGFIFIFGSMLMCMTSFSFLIGGNLEKLMCEPLTDPQYSVFKRLVDGPNAIIGTQGEYFLGSTLLSNGTINLTLSGVLEGCKNNGAAYSVLKLSNLFDLNTVTDYRDSIDIQAEIDNMDVDFSTIEILTPELRNQLQDFSDAVQIDYQGFRDELSKNTTKVNLLDFADDLDAAASASSEPSTTTLSSAATDLRNTHSGIYTTVRTDQAQLMSDINQLESDTSQIPTSVNDTLEAVLTSEAVLQANGSDIVKTEAINYGNRVLGIADSYGNNTLSAVTGDVARCLPIWNLWESMVHISLCKYIMDTFNGFWFSIGWCIFFMVPSIIFNVKLAKHLRRMETLETFDATEEKSDSNMSNGKTLFGNLLSSSLLNLNQTGYKGNAKTADISIHIAKTPPPSPGLNNLNKAASNQQQSNMNTQNGNRHEPVENIQLANLTNKSKVNQHYSPVGSNNVRLRKPSSDPNPNYGTLESYVEGGYSISSYNNKIPSNNVKHQYNNVAYVPEDPTLNLGGNIYSSSPSNSFTDNEHYSPIVQQNSPLPTTSLSHESDNLPPPPPLDDIHYTSPHSTLTRPHLSGNVQPAIMPTNTQMQYPENKFAIYAVPDKSHKSKSSDDESTSYEVSESQSGNSTDGNSVLRSDEDATNMVEEVGNEDGKIDKPLGKPKSILKKTISGKVTFDLPPQLGENA